MSRIDLPSLFFHDYNIINKVANKCEQSPRSILVINNYRRKNTGGKNEKT